MSLVEHFTLGLNGQQKAIVQYLNHRITERHGLEIKMNYEIPMYYRKSWVCYLNPIKKDGVELAFLKGHRLSNEQGVLSMKNRKLVAGIEFFDVNDIPIKEIDEIIQEAIILDDLYKK